VAHTCIPSYSGSRDQEKCGSKIAWANSSTRPYLEKNPSQKKKKIGTKFKPQYCKKKKKRI
jgi:hypothetical protein